MRSVIARKLRCLPGLVSSAARWHARYLFMRRPSPIACGVYITNRCNFRCAFCNIWRKPRSETLPLSRARSLVDNLRGLGTFYLSLSGGEPLLVDYLFEILSYARHAGLGYIHMVTNGYLLDPFVARRLKESGIDEVSISIDGPREIHDRNRGMSGAYERAVSAIEHLKTEAPGVAIVLNAIFMPEEPEQCFHALELAHRFGIHVKVQPLNQHPSFDPGNAGVIGRSNLSGARIRDAVRRLRRDRRVVNSPLFLANMYNFLCDRRRLIFHDAPCIFGYHHLEVLENSTVFPCLEGMGWEGGALFDGDLKAILDSRAYRDRLQGLKRCPGCRRNYYVCYYEPRINFPLSHFLRSVISR